MKIFAIKEKKKKILPLLGILSVASALALAVPASPQSEIAVSLDRPDPFSPVSGLVTVEAVVAAFGLAGLSSALFFAALSGAAPLAMFGG